MASFYVRDRSPFYWLRVKGADGVWRGVNSGVRVDDPDALRKVKGKVAEQVSGEVRAGGGLVRFDAWVPGFLRGHYTNELSLTRARGAWKVMSVFLQARKIRYPSQVTHGLGREYVAWRMAPPRGAGVKARGRNTAILEVKFFALVMHEAVRAGWIVANPLVRLGLKRAPARRKREITVAEQVVIERELAGEPVWMRDCWLVGMRQGCRLRETGVLLEDVDLQARVVTFRVKGGRDHSAPLHKDLVGLVERRVKEGAVRLVDLPARPSKVWCAFFRRCGLGHLSFHSTRVTVATRFAREGVPMSQAMAYVGHASETMHRVYQRLRPMDVAKLGELLK